MYENKIIESIPLKYINPNPEQPRKYFDPDSLEALAKSILRYGVINPITVKKINDKRYDQKKLTITEEIWKKKKIIKLLKNL